MIKVSDTNLYLGVADINTDATRCIDVKILHADSQNHCRYCCSPNVLGSLNTALISMVTNTTTFPCQMGSSLSNKVFTYFISKDRHKLWLLVE